MGATFPPARNVIRIEHARTMVIQQDNLGSIQAVLLAHAAPLPRELAS
jgi:hypothetical protein